MFFRHVLRVNFWEAQRSKRYDESFSFFKGFNP